MTADNINAHLMGKDEDTKIDILNNLLRWNKITSSQYIDKRAEIKGY